MPKVLYMDEERNNEEKNTSFDIDYSLLEIGIRKGLIEKSGNSYYFIGEYEELLAFINCKRKLEIFEWSD